MPELDLKDRKILYELDVNARRTDSEIAKKVGLSREVVSYRINRLIKEGIIKNFVTVLNHYALGYLGFRVFFKMKDISVEKEKEVVNYFKNKAAWVVRVRGNWSFNTMIFTTNIFEFEKYMNSFKKQFQDSIVTIHTSLITRIYHYRRGYLLNKKEDDSNYQIMGEVVKPITLDEIDLKILGVIQNNARANSIEIANQIGSNERIVRYRLKQLIDNKVILGFRSLPDVGKLGMSYYKVHFFLKKYDDETLKKIFAYAHIHPNITYKTEAIGGWDLELEFQVVSDKELYSILDDITKKFPGTINDYEVMEYEKEYGLSYLNKI